MDAILSISLALSIAPSAESLDPIYSFAECWNDPFVLGQAPENNRPDLDLLNGIQDHEGGILFSKETARGVLWRLRCLNKWPEMAQIKLDEQKSLFEYRLRRERELVDQNLEEAVAEPSSGPSWPNTILAVGGSFVLGLVIGGAVVFTATN